MAKARQLTKASKCAANPMKVRARDASLGGVLVRGPKVLCGWAVVSHPARRRLYAAPGLVECPQLVLQFKAIDPNWPWHRPTPSYVIRPPNLPSSLSQPPPQLSPLLPCPTAARTQNRSSGGGRPKPMPATATTMVKTIWQGYFFLAQAKDEAEAAKVGGWGDEDGEGGRAFGGEGGRWEALWVMGWKAGLW